jgi:hypothetical protein
MIGLAKSKLQLTDLEEVLNAGGRPIDTMMFDLARTLGI